MSDLLRAFRDRAAELIASISREGGLQTTIDSLRRQMAESDRRRAVRKIKTELKDIDKQITEMITAVGVQAVGLHEAGLLSSVELTPLCQHIVDLKEVLADNEAKLAQLEAEAAAEEESSVAASASTVQATDASQSESAAQCAACSKRLPEGSTFCPYCGTRVPAEEILFCAGCGTALRKGARFCPQCGQSVTK